MNEIGLNTVGFLLRMTCYKHEILWFSIFRIVTSFFNKLHMIEIIDNCIQTLCNCVFIIHQKELYNV